MTLRGGVVVITTLSGYRGVCSVVRVLPALFEGGRENQCVKHFGAVPQIPTLVTDKDRRKVGKHGC